MRLSVTANCYRLRRGDITVVGFPQPQRNTPEPGEALPSGELAMGLLLVVSETLSRVCLLPIFQDQLGCGACALCHRSLLRGGVLRRYELPDRLIRTLPVSLASDLGKTEKF